MRGGSTESLSVLGREGSSKLLDGASAAPENPAPVLSRTNKWWLRYDRWLEPVHNV